MKGVSVRFEDRPSNHNEQISWIEAHRKRELECWTQIEERMTDEQRSTLWALIGEPAGAIMRELKAHSLAAAKWREPKGIVVRSSSYEENP